MAIFPHKFILILVKFESGSAISQRFFRKTPLIILAYRDISRSEKPTGTADQLYELNFALEYPMKGARHDVAKDSVDEIAEIFRHFFPSRRERVADAETDAGSLASKMPKDRSACFLPRDAPSVIVRAFLALRFPSRSFHCRTDTILPLLVRFPTKRMRVRRYRLDGKS